MYITAVLFLLLQVAGFAQELYWESPQVMIGDSVRFPRIKSSNGKIVILWQEFTKTGKETGFTKLSMRISYDGTNWKEIKDFGGHFKYAGNEVPISSLAIDKNGKIYVAVSSGENEIKIISTNDDGNSFQQLARQISFSTTVAPRLFVKEDNSLILYVSQESDNENIAIFYSLSDIGENWTDFKKLVKEEKLKLNFLPHHESFNGKEYVVFQSLVIENRYSYQLYLKISNNGGKSWGPAIPLSEFTGFADGEEIIPMNYDNQRAFIKKISNKLYVTWERAKKGAQSQIFVSSLDGDGNIIDSPEQISHGGRACYSPRINNFNERLFITWFDNRRGDDHVILAERRGTSWIDRDMSLISGSSTFGEIVINNNIMYLFWENKLAESSRLVFLGPDKKAESPVIRPVNFLAGERYKKNQYSVRWNLPKDSSGIEGFSYIISKNKTDKAPERLMLLENQRSADFSIEEDGEWYVHVAAKDYAGNWSKSSTISFYRDTSPPGPVSFASLNKDYSGYLVSNSFSLAWLPPSDDAVSGYSYVFQYIGDDPENIDYTKINLVDPGNRINIRNNKLEYKNQDNGFWALSVRAIDTVGNPGKLSTLYLKLNKYVPVTYISRVRQVTNELGLSSLRIRGRGFSENGNVQELILDKDSKKPYDYVIKYNEGRYKVNTDRYIQVPELDEIDEGVYRIGLVHPERGLYFSAPIVKFEASGNVKFGDFRDLSERDYTIIGHKSFSISLNMVFVILIMFIMAFISIFSVKRMGEIYNEGRLLQKEVKALLSGTEMPLLYKEEKVIQMKRKGMGLRIKFVFVFMALVVAVVGMVSLPLGSYMISTQERNLATGLRDRANVLLESLASSARTYLPSKNSLELGFIPSQKTALEDSLYVTITGQSDENRDGYHYIWASDDPDLASKMKTDDLIPGVSIIDDSSSSAIKELEDKINQYSNEDVRDLSTDLQRLENEALAILRRSDAGADQALAEIQNEISYLEQIVNERLSAIGNVILSVPEFNINKIDYKRTEYEFFKPIIYRRSQDKIYFRGAVRLGVSTKNIIEELSNSRKRLILITFGIAVLAMFIGYLGALLFSTIIIQPIKALVKGVEIIRDTDDKENLKSHEIAINTKDEIFDLAETINQMTKGLVKAAAANKDLTVGKEVQKMFIPLEKDSSGNKLTTGSQVNDDVEIFGYYEGAKGVSGDYFDFQKIDERHYAIIKCDVAGKGVPAALIMVQVATIFLNYFKENKITNKNKKNYLEKLVYMMNDLVEERGFKGRFAALIVVLYDIKTGELNLCNAGDNLVHVFRKDKKEMTITTLPEAPAAGVFPNMLVEMQNGFKQITNKLEINDTLFLFTDGIEEAKRMFRDKNFNHTTCQEPGLKDGEQHDTHSKTSGDEELGIPRIHNIINAVMNKTNYSLFKYHNPIENEELEFTFSDCEGSVEEAVLAMVSVEKVFRMYPDPSATEDDKVIVDKKINEFLKKHFVQYSKYFNNEKELASAPEYVYFTHIKEDEQYDDLTILGVRKK